MSTAKQWVVWCDPEENSKTLLPKFLVLTDERQEFVAECRDPNEARLIAAAPDLLAACKILVAWARGNNLIGTSQEPPGIDEAQAAIANAEGKL